MPSHEITLLGHQCEALNSSEKYVAIISGIGGGKTWTGCHWVIQKSVTHKKSLGFIGANTFAQLRNSTLAALFSELDRLGLSYSYNQSSGIFELMGKKWLCKSLDNYDPLRGIEVGEIWLDEAAYMKREAYNVIVGRLRDKFGSLQVLVTTTPKGFNWVYDLWAGEQKTDQHKLIRAKSTDNIFLPDGYIESLGYDDKLAAQELMGEFVNIQSGRVYYGFSRECCADITYDGQIIYVGLDFNVNPYCGVLSYVENDVIYVFDEIYIKDSNTPEVSRYIYDKYGRCKVIPDSTGGNRSTKGPKTDHQILEELHEVLRVRNPYRTDRYNCVNGLLTKNKIKIDNKCKMLIKDMEQLAYKEGTDMPDVTQDKSLGHITDSIGYLCWKLFPLKKFRTASAPKQL